MIMLARMTTTEFREFMAPKKWMTMEQSLVLTAAILVTGGVLIYTRLRAQRRLLLEVADLYKQLSTSYQKAPPEVQFRIEMRERETNANYRRWLETTEKGREWERNFQGFLRSAQGKEWRARYDASRNTICWSSRSNSEES